MPYCLQYLEKLVSFDTVSGTPPERDCPNTALIDWVKAEMERLGAFTRVQSVAEGKANLFVQLGGDASHFTGLLMTGHSDTVSCDAERWRMAPRTLTIREDKAYGLGACDMKGFIAVAMNRMRKAAETQSVPADGLALLVTCDEETSMQGARVAAPWLKLMGVAPKLIVVGEPTALTPIFGHKGFMGERLTITGKSAHSSDPRQGRNAIASGLPSAVIALNTMAKEMMDALDPDFDRPDRPGVPYPTLNLGVIRGGDSVNRVCSRVEMDFDVRPMTQWNADRVNRDLAELAKRLTEEVNLPVTIEALYPDVPPFRNDDAAVKATVERVVGCPGEFVSYCTEAGFMATLGPTVVLGPGSIREAHAVDEFVPLKDLERMGAMLEKLEWL